MSGISKIWKSIWWSKGSEKVNKEGVGEKNSITPYQAFHQKKVLFSLAANKETKTAEDKRAVKIIQE